MKKFILLCLVSCLVSYDVQTYHYKTEANEEENDISFPITKNIKVWRNIQFG